MKNIRAARHLGFVTSAFVLGACGSSASTVSSDPLRSEALSGSIGTGPDAPFAPASKIDVLFVTDDSGSMDSKSALLGPHVGALLRSIGPNHDVHVGVITSSLTSEGLFSVCGDDASVARNAKLYSGGLASASAGFLAYDGTPAALDGFVDDAETLISNVGDGGCGLEASLESAYRFLVQPDPWKSVALDEEHKASYVGVDGELLAQRAAFLRPDSLVLVVLVTDEDDASLDPRAYGGRAYAFGGLYPLPRATSACATDPASPGCSSCAFESAKDDPNCADGGLYTPADDDLNVRFSNMKRRFGIDPRFPLSRYVAGFSDARVPNRDAEHPAPDPAATTAEHGYTQTGACTNPLFAATLPASENDELCQLPLGARSRDLVVFATLAGVPEALTGASPDWTAVLGTDPGNDDYTGIDPHMLPSIEPRAGLAAPGPLGDNGPDPIHGREWLTKGHDLQYACTFALPSAEPAAEGTDCNMPIGETILTPPVCNVSGEQTRGKAFPSIRPLALAKALGGRAVAASVCAADSDYTAQMTRIADFVRPRLTP